MYTRLPDDLDFPKYTAAHFYAALYVQAAVRGFLARHQMKTTIEKFNAEMERDTVDDESGDACDMPSQKNLLSEIVSKAGSNVILAKIKNRLMSVTTLFRKQRINAVDSQVRAHNNDDDAHPHDAER